MTPFSLDREESHHAVKVLRLKAHDRLQVTDGRGGLFECEIAENSVAAGLELLPLEKLSVPDETPHLTLCVGLLKKSAFETLVEQVAQFPVAAIVPVLSDHTAVKSDTLHSMMSRLRTKALVSMKQSRRTRLTEILPAQPFLEVLNDTKGDFRVLFEKCDPLAFPGKFPPMPERITLFIGPEGGFSGEEIQSAQAQFIPILNLGPSRLKAETAAVAAIASLLARLEKTP